FKGIADACEALDVSLGHVDYFVHGTTLAANTLIERTGTRTGLLVTEGFRDILEIRRMRLESSTDFFLDKPVPLVPRMWVKPVRERMLADGTVEQPVDLDQAEHNVRQLVAEGVEAVVIAFIHSYRFPQHEQAVLQR